ncbi:hypothetical protein [Oceanisphaera marina]|nr:hypothetical protein [Oceanisphaera marina]
MQQKAPVPIDSGAFFLLFTDYSAQLEEAAGIVVVNRQMPGMAFAERRMDAG